MCHEFVESLIDQNERILHELQKIHEAELQKELEELEERHNRSEEDLEALASTAMMLWEDLQEEPTVMEMAAEEINENLLDHCREFKEAQAEVRRTLEDLYRKALRTNELLKEDADDEPEQLNETVQSLHDEMEEAQALEINEETHSFVVLEGEEKDAEQSKCQFIKSLWRSLFQWFSSSLGSSVKSLIRLIQPIPMVSIIVGGTSNQFKPAMF